MNCPECGSAHLRLSRYRGIRERMQAVFGVYPVRCRECRARFAARTWRARDFRFASCPKCLRRDLGRWSTEDYSVSSATRLSLAFGAHPYRCEYCRHNFVSFRRRKQRFGERYANRKRFQVT